MSQCKGYECLSTDLIKAHILPRGIARDIMGDRNHIMKASIDQVEYTQHGVYDPNILCAKCDGILGKYDDYAIKVFRRFPDEHIDEGNRIFVVPNVSGDKLALFVLAVLWRASVSTRQEFKKVELGPYEDIARDVLFGVNPLNSMRSYELCVYRYEYAPINRELRFSSSPLPERYLNGLKLWMFTLDSFSMIAKLDKRPMPKEDHPFVVNAQDKLLGRYIDFEITKEYQRMISMEKADIERKRRA